MQTTIDLRDASYQPRVLVTGSRAWEEAHADGRVGDGCHCLVKATDATVRESRPRNPSHGIQCLWLSRAPLRDPEARLPDVDPTRVNDEDYALQYFFEASKAIPKIDCVSLAVMIRRRRLEFMSTSSELDLGPGLPKHDVATMGPMCSMGKTRAITQLLNEWDRFWRAVELYACCHFGPEHAQLFAKTVFDNEDAYVKSYMEDSGSSDSQGSAAWSALDGDGGNGSM